MKNDFRDWFTMLLVSVMWIASTVYLFVHPSGTVFCAWASLCATMGGIFHWLNITDAKRPDAPCGDR